MAASDDRSTWGSGCWRWFAAIVVLAAALRIAWGLWIAVEPVSDCARYDFFARNLAAGKGYVEDYGPTAYWPVGPSFLYSLSYRLTGPDSPARFQTVVALNVLMGVGTVVFAMLAARRWLSPRGTLLAGLLLAVWPSQILFTTVLSSETPMLLFMTAALAVWSADRPGLWTRAVIAGVLLAAASFMRPTALLLPFVFGLGALTYEKRRLRVVVAVGVMAAAMLAAILPWSVRNTRALGQFVLISTNGGPNFWMGNHPGTTGFYAELPEEEFRGEIERHKRLKSEALDYIRSDPTAFVKRSLAKAVRLHERETIGVVWNESGMTQRMPASAINAVKWGGQLFWMGALGLGVIGAVILLWRGPLLAALLSPMILTWGYFTAVHAVTVIQDRYHFAVIPFIAMLAAVAIERVCRTRRTCASV